MEGTKRHPIFADYHAGFDNEGRLLAMKIRITLDGGAYTSKTFPVTRRMAIEGTEPYQSRKSILQKQPTGVIMKAWESRN